MSELPFVIAKAIDAYRVENPNVMVSEVLAALEHVRFEIVDGWINTTDPEKP